MDFRFLQVLSVVVWLSLLGCKAEISYEYLMTHPQLLRKKYAACQGIQSPECGLVRQATSDFVSLLKERESDPIAFGIKIMQAQERLVALDLMREKAKRAHDDRIVEMTNVAYCAEYQKIQEFYRVIQEMEMN